METVIRNRGMDERLCGIGRMYLSLVIVGPGEVRAEVNTGGWRGR